MVRTGHSGQLMVRTGHSGQLMVRTGHSGQLMVRTGHSGQLMVRTGHSGQLIRGPFFKEPPVPRAAHYKKYNGDCFSLTSSPRPPYPRV